MELGGRILRFGHGFNKHRMGRCWKKGVHACMWACMCAALRACVVCSHEQGAQACPRMLGILGKALWTEINE